MNEVQVTTWTSMSATTPDLGTVAITSKVVESVESAMAHVRAMGDGQPAPVVDVRSGGWRWTWERRLTGGGSVTDTVRIF